MIKHKDEIIDIEILSSSLVNFGNTKYPMICGNYCTIKYNDNELHLINMCKENLQEIIKRLDTRKLKVRIFEGENISTIAIIDDRISQDWYIFWTDGYNSGCSPDVGVEIYETLGERYTNQKEKPLTFEKRKEKFIKNGGKIYTCKNGLEIWES